MAGIAFVTLAATNVLVMLEASQPSRNGTTKARLVAAHRVGGYLFVALFCIMAYSMSQRLAGLGITSHLPTHLVLHIVLAIILVPLILLKILFARRYKQSHSSLKALGVTLFVVSFVLVSIPALSELLRSASPGSLGLRLATGLVVGVCLLQCAWVLRSKRKQSRASVELSRIPEIPAPATPLTAHENAKGPMTLLLAQIEQQTHDTNTLRFLVPKERHLCAKPGQFLTSSGRLMANEYRGLTPFPPRRSTRTMWRSRPSAWKTAVSLFFSIGERRRVSRWKQTGRTATFTLTRRSTKA